MGPVSEPVQKRGGHVGIAKDLGPVDKAEVGRDDHRAPLVTLGQDLKKQLRAHLGEGDITELVEDEQIEPGISSDQAAQVFLGASFDEFVGQGVAGHEAHPLTLPAGLAAQGGGQMGLAGAAFAQQDDVAFVLKMRPCRQLAHQALIQGRRGLEVEGLKGLEQGKPGLLEAALFPVVRANAQLQLGELQQELRIIGSFVPGLAQIRFQMPGHVGQVQGLEIVLQQHGLGGIAHDPPPNAA